MRWLFLLLFVALAWSALPGDDLPASPGIAPHVSAEVFLGRDYGYFLGDLVEVAYRVSLPPDYYLNVDFLPRVDETLDEWLEVRKRSIREVVSPEGRIYQIYLVLQIFQPGGQDHPRPIPRIGFLYGYQGNLSAYSSVLPATPPILVSALTVQGGAFQPEIPFSWSSSSPEIIRSIGIALLLCSTFLLSFWVWTRRSFRTRSPFKVAMGKLSHEKDPAAALVIFRNALNEKAGRAIFPRNVEDFFRVFPGAKPYEKEVHELLALSERISFNPEGYEAAGDAVHRVFRITKELRRRERWE